MSAIRRLESNQLNNPDIPGKNKKKGDLPSTLNFNVSVQGQGCIMINHGKVHKKSNEKPSKSLQYCDHFTKNLKLHERNIVIKVDKICTKCLVPGHKQTDCKSSSVCGNCNSNTHHALVCRISPDGKPTGKEGQASSRCQHNHIPQY